jgi:hypothetical protein
MGFQITREGSGVELPCNMNAALTTHMNIEIVTIAQLLFQMAILWAPPWMSISGE